MAEPPVSLPPTPPAGESGGDASSPEAPLAAAPAGEAPPAGSAAGEPAGAPHPVFVATVTLLAWAVPGMGHLVLRRWGRALGFFLVVSTLAALGIVLRGNIFAPEGGDLFEILGFLADLGAGVYYFLARMVDNGGPDVSRAAGDYGTRFFATAGVLNLLCALDAYEIATRQKE